MSSKNLAVYMYRSRTSKSTRKIVEDYLQIVPHIKTEVLAFDEEKTVSAPCIAMPYVKGQPCIQYVNRVLCRIPSPQPCFRSIFYYKETKDNDYYFEFSLSGAVVILKKEEYEYLFN